MRWELALRGLLWVMEGKLTLSWAICWAIWLRGKVWNLGTVLLMLVRLVIRSNEIDCSHLHHWSLCIDLYWPTSAELAGSWILVFSGFINHKLLSWGRDHLRLIQIHVSLIRNLTGKRRLRVWLHPQSHCIVLIVHRAFRTLIVALHLLFSFFLGHIVLLVALVVAHEGTFVKSDSLGSKRSI